MAPQIVYVRVHEPDAVRKIMHEAAAIAKECQDDGWDFLRACEKAADLLSARTVMQQQQVPFDLNALRG